MRVLQIAHGGERNVDQLVDAVIAFLHVRRQDADHLEADAVDADELAQRVLAGEELGFGLRADDGDPRARHLVFLVQQTALRQDSRPGS